MWKLKKWMMVNGKSSSKKRSKNGITPNFGGVNIGTKEGKIL